MSRQDALRALQQRLEQLKNHVPEHDATANIRDASTFYLLGPTSFLGNSFAAPIARKLLAMGKSVFLVDDTIAGGETPVANCPVIGSAQLMREDAAAGLAINMANAVFAHGFFAQAAARAGIPVIDIIPALDAFDLPVIYQPAQAMREKTLARLDDYLALAKQLDDAFSIQTLGAFIELRVSLDRNALLPILCSLEDEYFSPYPAGKDITFALREDEILCDVGAHVGTTIYKFLTANRWKYQAIHAFEPDTGNFAALKRGIFESLPNFHPRNMALSDTRSMLSFSETGTMGSRLDTNGNTQVQASTLDDEVPHATFIKMDVEGHEARILRGATRLIAKSKPRLAITGYHFADDLLEIVQVIRNIEPGYRLRLRHHSFYYYDTILYADVAS